MNHDVISAFIDNEPFDPQELAAALAEPAGRALLLDLIALRHVTQPDEAFVMVTRRIKAARIVLWMAAAAASVAIAVVGGYQVGSKRDAASTRPPEPTVVVKVTEWQPLPAGGVR